MLPGLGYHTPQEGLMDKCGEVVEWWSAGKEGKKLEKKSAPVPLHRPMRLTVEITLD
jgi:hypothetical protein